MKKARLGTYPIPSRHIARSLAALGLALGLFLSLSAYLAGADTAPSDRGVDQAALEPERATARSVGDQKGLVPDPRVAVLMEQITTGALLRYEWALTGETAVMVGGELYTITTRNSTSGEPISQATQYVYERFQDLGLDTTFHVYTSPYGSQRWRNVVGERRGSRRPDEIYLITAHLDDLPVGAIAPGADDNASGSTAVLLAAENLRQLDFGCTVRFVLFTGEEQGLLGSAAYAQANFGAGEDIRGVLNLDMIGYNSDLAPIIDLHAQSGIAGSLEIAETFSEVVAAYDLDLLPDILVDNWLGYYSDNGSFWRYGYPAILAIEDYDDFTPYYHTSGDALSTLDLNYFTQFVKAAVGTFAHMSCPPMGLLRGTVTARDTGLPLAATVTAAGGGFTYATETGADGTYSLTLPVYTFTLQAHVRRAPYGPGTATNVIVAADRDTVQHLPLERWAYELYLPLGQWAYQLFLPVVSRGTGVRPESRAHNLTK